MNLTCFKYFLRSLRGIHTSESFVMRLIRNVHIIVRDSPVFQDQQISIFDLTSLVLTNGLCQRGKKPYFPLVDIVPEATINIRIWCVYLLSNLQYAPTGCCWANSQMWYKLELSFACNSILNMVKKHLIITHFCSAHIAWKVPK